MLVLFDSMLNQFVKMINLIKSRPLNSHLFGFLCQEMGSGHKQLLLHTEVRWFTRGRVLQWLYELWEEVKLLLTEIKSDLAKHLDDTMWLASLSYLVDIFDRLSGLNLSLQGRKTHYFAPCRQSRCLHTKPWPLAWPHQLREVQHVQQPWRLYHWCRHVTQFLLSISISVWAPVSNEKTICDVL